MKKQIFSSEKQEQARGQVLDVNHVRERFGLRERCHRIGEMDLRIAEVERPDDMVREVYPDAVSGHGDAPVWMITWPAALALAEDLVLEQRLEGASVLELGCGTAAPGIAAAMAGAHVVCTDYDPITLELARYNARLNGCTNLTVRPLDWYAPEIPGRFEWIIGSEIVYFEKSFAPLLSVLRHEHARGGRVLLSDQGRPQMKAFLQMCRQEGFTREEHFRTVHLHRQSHRIRIVTLTR